jgi:hypothetical protein
MEPSKELIDNTSATPTIMNIIGKTIISADIMQLEGFDDQGFLRLAFSDGSAYIVESSYNCDYTGKSEGEYGTTISVTEERLWASRRLKRFGANKLSVLQS